MSRLVSRYWRDVGVVLSGSAAAQFIPLVGSLVLARLIVPAEFGHFAAWLGLASLAAVALTGRYDMAIVLENSAERRRAGAFASLVVTGLSGALLVTACVLASWLLRDRADGLSYSLLMLLAPTAMLIAVSQVWQAWAASEQRFADLSSIRIAQACGITGLQILAGLTAPSATSLALAHAAGVAIGIVLAACRLPLVRVASNLWRNYLVEHGRFPRWSLPAGLISTGAAQMPVLLVASRFGAEAAGLLAMAMRILGAPTALLGASVLDVFKVSAARSFREHGQCREDYLRTLKGLGIGSMLTAVPLIIWAESLFAFAFGESWRGAGTTATWLIPMFALRFVASPLSYMFFIAGRQKLDLVWQVSLLTMTLASLTLSTTFPVAMKSYDAGYSALYVLYLWMSYSLSCGSKK